MNPIAPRRPAGRSRLACAAAIALALVGVSFGVRPVRAEAVPNLDRAYAALRSGNAGLDQVRLIGLAAARGDATAADVLGYLFATGTVIARDPVRAVGWYVRAGASGAPNGLANARVVLATLNQRERARLDPTWLRYLDSASVPGGPAMRRIGGPRLGPGPRADGPMSPDRELVAKMVVAATAGTSVTPALAKAVAKVESNFRADAHSSAGARGVMQIMPSTAAGEFGVHPDTLWDAQNNAVLGVRYLDSLIDRYGAVDVALSHYNGGSSVGPPGRAHVTPWTRDYVDSVLAWERVYAGRAPGVPSDLPMADSPGTGPTQWNAAQADAAQPVANRKRTGGMRITTPQSTHGSSRVRIMRPSS